MKKYLISFILLSSITISCNGLSNEENKLIEDNKTNETNNDNSNNESSYLDNDTPYKPEDKPSEEEVKPANPEDSIPDTPTDPETGNQPESGDEIDPGSDSEPGSGGENPGTDPEPQDPVTPSEPDNPSDPVEDDPSVEPPIDPIPPSDESVVITGIELLVHDLSMYLGHTYKLNYQTLPQNTSNVVTYFKSDIPSIVSTTSDGTLKANKVGKTLITVITEEGYVDKCIVSVVENPNFKFSSPCLDLYINSTKSFAISGSGITYESDDPSIAIISQNGQIQTFDKPGRVLLTARKDNNIATCDLRVFINNQDIFKFTDIDSSTCSVDGFVSTDVAVANLIVPFENNQGKKVVKISDQAFNCMTYEFSKKRRSILLPNSIKEIGNNSLAYGEADNFYTPYYLEKIGQFAFMNFYFNSIELNINLKEIGMRAFINCHKFEEIVIPYQTVVRNNCFHDCNPLASSGGLKRVYFQEGATLYETESEYFNGCNTLQSMNIPTSFKTIPSKTFYFVYKPAFQNGIFIPKSVINVNDLNFYRENDNNALPFDIFIEHEELPTTYSSNNKEYYLYSKNQPTTNGKYWHYVSGEITKW